MGRPWWDMYVVYPKHSLLSCEPKLRCRIPILALFFNRIDAFLEKVVSDHVANVAHPLAVSASSPLAYRLVEQPPPRPKIRSTFRTESTVTLEWHCGLLPVTTAYELQWRQRGRAASDWVSACDKLTPTIHPVCGVVSPRQQIAPSTV